MASQQTPAGVADEKAPQSAEGQNPQDADTAQEEPVTSEGVEDPYATSTEGKQESELDPGQPTHPKSHFKGMPRDWEKNKPGHEGDDGKQEQDLNPGPPTQLRSHFQGMPKDWEKNKAAHDGGDDDKQEQNLDPGPPTQLRSHFRGMPRDWEKNKKKDDA